RQGVVSRREVLRGTEDRMRALYRRPHYGAAGLWAVPRRHAVVVGGGLAGMLAARVLSDHFDNVTVLERDRFPEAPAARDLIDWGVRRRVAALPNVRVHHGADVAGLVRGPGDGPRVAGVRIRPRMDDTAFGRREAELAADLVVVA